MFGRAIGLMVLLGSMSWVAPAIAEPKPAIAPASWELDFEFHDPQRITLTLPGDKQETTFWYLLYTAANHTGEEVGFFPTFEIVTDDFNVIEGGTDVSPSVYDAILTRHRKAYPFSVDPMSMYGPLLQGEDNARTSVIAFRSWDAKVNGFTLYVGGLSGEVVKVRNRRFDRDKPESEENRQFFYLRKTLAIDYSIPGDRRTTVLAVPARSKQDWVMR